VGSELELVTDPAVEALNLTGSLAAWIEFGSGLPHDLAIC
jgi:hypothetical protein